MASPIKKITSGSVTASIWENESGRRSATFQTSWKDKDGKWQHSEFIPDYKVPELLAVVTRLAMEGLRVTATTPAPQQTQTRPAPQPQEDTDGLPF